MNKKYVNISLIILTFLLMFFVFLHNETLKQSVVQSAELFIYKVFPFIFIMMILNNLLISFNFPYYINKIFHNPFIYIFIMSLLSGCPVNALIIRNFLDSNILKESEAQLAICFSTINNPLFIYSYLMLIFNSVNITLKLLIIIYLSNLIILIICIKKSKTSNCTIKYIKINYISNFVSSITSSLPNLLNIFAVITFFKLICDLFITINTPLSIFLKGLIEVTQGLNLLTTIQISCIIKELLVIVILSFCGLSIHIQISSILSDYNINYKYFYFSRIFLIIINLSFLLIFK